MSNVIKTGVDEKHNYGEPLISKKLERIFFFFFFFSQWFCGVWIEGMDLEDAFDMSNTRISILPIRNKTDMLC